jgi:uncharacterized Ntn-hydrolase superfamily protein
LNNLVSTFSIVAIDLYNGDLGVAVQSKYFSVGNIVPWVEAEVGAIATQAFVNVSYGPNGLKLLREGFSADEVITELTQKDEEREERQLGVVDAKGNVACFTGKNCLEWAGSKTGTSYTAQGNILASEDVVLTMAEYFENAEGELADKLVAALEGGQAAGGDARGRQSAALIVMRKGAGRAGYGDRYIELRGLAHTYNQVQASWEAILSKKHSEALKFAKRAVTITPLNDEAHVVLGLAYYLLGDTDASINEFHQVFQINPNMKDTVKFYLKECSIEDDDFVQKILRK